MKTKLSKSSPEHKKKNGAQPTRIEVEYEGEIGLLLAKSDSVQRGILEVMFADGNIKMINAGKLVLKGYSNTSLVDFFDDFKTTSSLAC